MFYISTTQYNILTRICKGFCVKIRYKFPQIYQNLTNPGFHVSENRDERAILAVSLSYPVVIVPSALMRIDTVAKGPLPGPEVWANPLAGSKTAPCAGQTICCWPVS